jgi:PAS domain S-box-containing protein
VHTSEEQHFKASLNQTDDRKKSSAKQSSETFHRRFLWAVLTLALLLVIAVGVAGWFYLEHQEARVRTVAGKDLASVVAYKAGQITSWAKEQHGVASTTFDKSLALQFLADPGNSVIRGRVLLQMHECLQGNEYDAMALFDGHGALCLAAPEEKYLRSSDIVRYIRACLDEKNIVITDVQDGQPNPSVHLAILLPVGNATQAGGSPEGVLLFEINPRQFIYPLVEHWPTPSRTAELMLIRREGNKMVCLNELSSRTNAGPGLLLSIQSKRDLAAVLAASGNDVLVEGRDYRGTQVLAIMHEAPGTPWDLVAKVDLGEIYAPLRQQVLIGGLLAAIMMLIILLIFSLVWHKQRMAYARRELAERLRASEEMRKLTLAIEQSPVSIVITDPAGNIEYVNPKFCEISGYSAEEALGKNPRILKSGEMPKEDYKGLWETISAGKEWHGEFHNRKKNGEYYWESAVISPVFDHAGKITRFLGIKEDITERKRTENMLLMFQFASDHSSDAVFWLDRNGRISYVNDQACRSLGYTREELLRMSIFDVDAAFTQRQWDENWRESYRSRMPAHHQFESVHRRKDGSTFPVEVIAENFFMDGADVHVGYARDITGRHRLEEQLRQAQKMEAVGRLAGGIAHDFNNILAVIQIHADLMKADGKLPVEQRESISEISTAAQRAAALTRQLLLFGRKEVMQSRELELNECVNNMTKMLRRLIGEDIELQFRFAPQMLYIHADSGMMDQVLMNLAVNSRDAMPKGGRLVIETAAVELDELAVVQSSRARIGSFVCLSVSDTGVGIPAESYQRIFEPFFTTKEVGKGTGLGLAAVHGIVEQHQGWITVYSELGRGTTFRIYLPRLKNRSVTKLNEPVPAPLPGGNETILFVEDDAFVRASIRNVLLRLGYRVFDANNGIEAVKVWQEHGNDIHLLLTDLVMPGGMDGKELAEILLKSNPKLKVIYASGYSAQVAGQDLRLQECVNFLGKPIQAVKLAQTLRTRLDE